MPNRLNYVNRQDVEVLRSLNDPKYKYYSSAVYAPGFGYLLPVVNEKGQKGMHYSGHEKISDGFDVLLIEESGGWRVFISNLDSANECFESISTFVKVL